MDTAAFDYELPPTYIAQQPATPRDSSRLLVLHRATGQIEHRFFYDIGDYLCPGDLLVANNSRVIPARLHGRKATGGKVEVFLLNQVDADGLMWECLVRGRGLVSGVEIVVDEDAPVSAPLVATVVNVHQSGTRTIRFSRSPLGAGEIPLPPYVTEYAGDRERYQTVYSQPEGSAAAPTAGLHFTPELLLALRKKDIDLATVTLHVGLDTFKPIEVDQIEAHQIHSEWAQLDSDTARRINTTTLRVRRVIAVGTTTARTLEWAATAAQDVDPYDEAACPWQRVVAFRSSVDLYIRPGYRFRAVDALITNFHLPRSTLLLMVSAFIGQDRPHDIDAGRKMLLHTYEVAKREGYRFYSFGDAMLVV